MNLPDSPPARTLAHPPGWAEDPGSRRLGRYVLGPEMGHGGMGQVHLAWDPLLRRRVAIKLLLRGDPDHLLRFIAEARIQAKLEHPRVCKVYEVGTEGTQFYIAMQFIDGRSLGDARGGLGLRETVAIFAEVAGAVEAAHRLHLVHRDIKPSNILLEEQADGSLQPFVLDFGLARDQSAGDLSLSWSMVGTPAFMSPEQARSEEPSPASDIYSLGATFYAIFAGHPPFEAESVVGLATQQAEAGAEPIQRLRPGFPEDLDTIILKCLEADPARRYPSAGAVEEDLRRWLAGKPISARAAGILEQAWRAVVRRGSLSVAVAAGLAALVALGGWDLLAARRVKAQLRLGQQFTRQGEEAEHALGLERMLPAHDLRGAAEGMRRSLQGIRAAMAAHGPEAEGPGRYALGRVHLALDEWAEAKVELERAWAAGYRTPEAAGALGEALFGLFLEGRRHLVTADPGLRPEAGRDLDARLGAPAHAYLSRSLDRAPWAGSLTPARIALLEGDPWRCVRLCREAFQARPWLYEAKLLEAEALGLAQSPGAASESVKDAIERLEMAGKALDQALDIARSDDRLHHAALHRLALLVELQLASGNPALDRFREADAHFAAGAAISPDSPLLLGAWAAVRIQEAAFQASRGQDPRPFVEATLRVLGASEGALRRTGETREAAELYRLLASLQVRRGEDPRPALASADRWYPPRAPERVPAALLKAEWLIGRGQDPGPALDEAEDLLGRTDARQGATPLDAGRGLLELARAEWAACRGADPLEHLDRGIACLARSRTAAPALFAGHSLLAQGLALRGGRSLALGLDPGADLDTALGVAQKALDIAPRQPLVHLALAEVLAAQALQSMAQGGDPGPATARALAAVEAGLKLTRVDFRFPLLRARAELAAAQHALARGASPLAALDRAEASARQALALKGDSAKGWLTLAKAARCRAEWARTRGGDGGRGAAGAGLAAARRALALNPALLEAHTERAALAYLASGEPKALASLAGLLQRHPLLAGAYRDYAAPGLPARSGGRRR